MQRMQRQFGKFLTRSADEAQVGMLIKDFEDADKMLDTVGLQLFCEDRFIANCSPHSSLIPQKRGSKPGPTFSTASRP